jgi:hypothetical protein
MSGIEGGPAMLGPDWRDLLPGDAVESAQRFLDSLSWNLTWAQEGSDWRVWGGEVLLFQAGTKPEAEAFVLGMGLALRALPNEVLDGIRRWGRS